MFLKPYFVDVHVYGFKNMRGYQLNLEITGPEASYGEITDISVDQAKPTYIFAGTPSVDREQAIDLPGLRVAGVLHSGGVKVRSYLTTFRLDRAAGAPESFTVTVETTTQTQVFDPDGCTEFPDNFAQDFPF